MYKTSTKFLNRVFVLAMHVRALVYAAKKGLVVVNFSFLDDSYRFLQRLEKDYFALTKRVCKMLCTGLKKLIKWCYAFIIFFI